MMIIYPAIDLRGGKVVRLREGNPDQQTVVSQDPIATAHKWQQEGAAWLHLVNLDGAFADDAGSAEDNRKVLEQLSTLGMKIQFGGGLRSLRDIARAFEQGAARVVLGTIAVEHPEILMEALQQHGAEKICVAMDVRDGKIATHGWRHPTEQTPLEFGRRIAQMGIVHALYTDVHRDGRLVGANIQQTVLIGRETGLQVIASGGVSSMEDIHQLARSKVVAGAIIGMALYEGWLTLGEALLAAQERNT